jgi:hypothetical protein
MFTPKEQSQRELWIKIQPNEYVRLENNYFEVKKSKSSIQKAFQNFLINLWDGTKKYIIFDNITYGEVVFNVYKNVIDEFNKNNKVLQFESTNDDDKKYKNIEQYILHIKDAMGIYQCRLQVKRLKEVIGNNSLLSFYQNKKFLIGGGLLFLIGLIGGFFDTVSNSEIQKQFKTLLSMSITFMCSPAFLNYLTDDNGTKTTRDAYRYHLERGLLLLDQINAREQLIDSEQHLDLSGLKSQR